MADIKISELEPTTDLEGLYTIGSDKNNLSKKVSLQFLKDAANYANEQGDYAKQAGDTVNSNVGVSDYPEFSASKSYVIGDIVRYNGVLYAFTANHAASAWNGSDVKATSINAITSGKLTELEEKVTVGTGIYVTTLAVSAGVSHSSTKDRVPCNIKKGESFYAYVQMRKGAELTQVSLNVTAAGYDTWQTLGNQKAYNPPTKWIAPYDITEIGYYIEGAHITSDGVIDVVIYAAPAMDMIEEQIREKVSNGGSILPVRYTSDVYMQIRSWQGAASYDKYLVTSYASASNGSAKLEIYDLEEKKHLQEVTISGMAVLNAHLNSISFGHKYTEEDALPLLYVSSGYTLPSQANATQVYVYRFIGAMGSLTSQLVQTITLNGFGGWTDIAIDSEHSRMWVKGNKKNNTFYEDYFCYELPALNGDIEIGEYGDAIDKFTLSSIALPDNVQKASGQQCTYYNGKLWITYGVPKSQGAESLIISVVNTRSHLRESTVWLDDIIDANLVDANNTYEPEGLFFWHDQLFIVFPSHLEQIRSVTESSADITAIGGYKVVSSIAELPSNGDANIGYIVGTHLYVYVGVGGNAKNGSYYDCGEFRGPQGERGYTGAQGEKGDTGPQGERGYTGETGPQGDKGDKGDKGDTGPQGPQGPQGNSGYTGAANELQVINDLVTGGATSALSAEQGKILNTALFGTGIYVTTLAVSAGVTHSSTKDRIPCYIGNGEPFYAYLRMRDGADVTQVSIVPSNPSSWQTLGNQKKGNPTKWTAPYEVVEIGYYIEGSHIKSSGVIDIVIISNPLSTLL